MSTQEPPMKIRGSAEEVQQKAKMRLDLAEQRRLEAEKSLAEHKAKGHAVLAKTVRLRALRLAKEAKGAADTLATTEQKARKDAKKSAVLKKTATKKPKAGS